MSDFSKSFKVLLMARLWNFLPATLGVCFGRTRPGSQCSWGRKPCLCIQSLAQSSMVAQAVTPLPCLTTLCGSAASWGEQGQGWEVATLSRASLSLGSTLLLLPLPRFLVPKAMIWTLEGALVP